MPARDVLAETFRRQALGAEVLGSPLYTDVLRRMADDAQAGGPVWDLLEEHATASLGAAYPLRVLGGAHRLALTGQAPDLARHLPSCDGDGDADGAWRALIALMASPPPEMLDALTRPPQTNEVGRAASLIGGVLVVADEHRLPVPRASRSGRARGSTCASTTTGTPSAAAASGRPTPRSGSTGSGPRASHRGTRRSRSPNAAGATSTRSTAAPTRDG